MANYTFPADGVLRPDAIKFYPRDDAGNFVSGVNLTITQGCGALSNRRETTDAQGNNCLLYDFTPPQNATGGSCFITATVDGTTCNCEVTITGEQLQVDCGALAATLQPNPVIVGEQVIFMFTMVDTNGNPLPATGWSVNPTGLASTTLNDLGNGNWSYTATPTQESGGITITGIYGSCPEIGFSATVVREMDCANVFCQPNADGYVVGEAQTISIFIPDTDGNAIFDGLNFEFDGADITSLPTYNPVNGRWEFNITPTSTTVVGSVISSTNQRCDSFCNLTAVNIGIDCNSIVCDYNGARVGETGRVDLTVVDTNGNPVDDATFMVNGGTLTANPIFSNGQWMVDFTVDQENVTISVLSALGNCTNACTITAGQAAFIDCDSVQCLTPDLPFYIDENGFAEVIVLDSDGNAINSGVTISLSGGTLQSNPVYNPANGSWGFNFIPAGIQTVVSILSDMGNCVNACSIAAINRPVLSVNCNAVQCFDPAGGFVIGQPAEIQVYVPDSNGDPVSSGVTFDFTGATLTSTPIYDSTTDNWVFNIEPTSETIVGSILTSSFGNCNNFCTLTAIPDGNVPCCPLVTGVNFSPLVMGDVFTGTIIFDDNSVANITGLPNGLTANGNSISGTPTEFGTFDINVRTANNCNTVIRVVVAETGGGGGNNCCPKLEAVSLPTGIVGDPYSGFAVFSGISGRTYQANGLPAGLSLNTQTGQITGTPTNIGNFSIDYFVTDSTGTCQYQLSIDVDQPRDDCPAECPRLNSVPSLAAISGSQVNLSLSATSETGVVSFTPVSVSEGLTLNSSGQITGIAPGAGSYPFNVEMSNGSRSCITQLFFTVIENAVIPDVEVGCESILMTVCAGEFDLDMQDKDWMLDSALPEGLSFNQGSFSGTIKEGIHSIRLTKGELHFKIILCVRECCAKGSDEYWVQVVGCETINGVTYNNSLSCPSDPIRVTKEQRDHLLANGLAVVCS